MMCSRLALAGLIALATILWPAALASPQASPGPVGSLERPAGGTAAEPTGSEAPGAGHKAGEHGAAAVNPLEFQTDLALWTAVVFLVLLAILWKWAWKPVAESLEKREQRIADQITSAEQANREAQRLLDEYQKRLSASGDEVRHILDGARRDAEQVSREIVEQARGDAQLEHRRALREIDQATAAALKELAERSATLAVELAGRIVAAKLDPADHRRLIEQAVAHFADN